MRANHNPVPQRVLLIQDDEPNAKLVLQALDGADNESFDVQWVRQVSDGLARLTGVSAILADLFGPGTHGEGDFDRLFRAAPLIPILLLIEPMDEDMAKLAVRRGAQDYLFKARLDAYLLPKAVGSMIERAAIAEKAFQEKERAEVTLNSIGDAVMSTDLAGRVTYLNAVAQRLTGWSQEDAAGQQLEEVFRIVDGATRERAENPMTLAVRENRAGALTPNCILIRRDGREAAIEDSAAPIHDRSGRVVGAVIVFRDVSVARAMTLKMAYLAQHDSLTDLPNRVLFNDRLAAAIALSARHRRRLAVLFVDLDGFKYINDSFGHTVGDRLLQSVARRLSACARSSDTVSRRGGDEFVIMLCEVEHASDAGITADKILLALREPHLIEGHELHVTGSIGIVTYPEDGVDAESLMKNADVAMYQAKESGRDNYHFFRSDRNKRARTAVARIGTAEVAIRKPVSATDFGKLLQRTVTCAGVA